MRSILLIAALVASSAASAQEAPSNGGMPDNFPATILVARVPYGSGIPSPGRSVGYSTAVPVGDGLYSVPGYLPGDESAASIPPRVVDVKCTPLAGTWYCEGYHIDGILLSGENVYVRPKFSRQ
jgi:hypothetical protein